MLRGNALAKLDDKGRLKLPTSFRSVIEPKYGNEFYVTSIRGDCARIYPMQVYVRLEKQLLESSSVEPAVTKLRHNLNYFGQSINMDSQGRILIHPLLRERAGMDGEVAVLGQQEFLEIWNHRTFETRLKNDPLTDDELQTLATLGF